MELFMQLFSGLLLFVYHCFDRIVINGYLSGLSRPEQVVHFFRQILGVPILSKEVLSQRTNDYQNWVEAFASNHHIPIEWAQKGLRKEDHVLPWLRRMRKKGSYGVYFIFKSMELLIIRTLTFLNFLSHRLQFTPSLRRILETVFFQHVRPIIKQPSVGKKGNRDKLTINGVIFDNARKEFSDLLGSKIFRKIF